MLAEVTQIRRHPSQYVLVDTRTREQYISGHIPGALWINCYDFLLESTSPEGIEKLKAYLKNALSPLTPHRHQTIVFYEDETGMRAARALWFLRFAGGANGLVLHGGLKAWVASGGELVSGQPGEAADKSVPYPVAGDLDILATYDDVLNRINRPGTVIVDARGPAEYNGLSVDPCCTVKGKIPGAVNLNWEMLIDPSGRFLPKDEILRIAAERGITPEQEVILYCHRGARSANTALALQWAGFEKVRNYIGSWHEWTRRPGAPVVSDSGNVK